MTNEVMERSSTDWGQARLVKLAQMESSALQQAATESERLWSDYHAAVERNPHAVPPPDRPPLPSQVRRYYLKRALPKEYGPDGDLTIFHDSH